MMYYEVNVRMVALGNKRPFVANDRNLNVFERIVFCFYQGGLSVTESPPIINNCYSIELFNLLTD